MQRRGSEGSLGKRDPLESFPAICHVWDALTSCTPRVIAWLPCRAMWLTWQILKVTKVV